MSGDRFINTGGGTYNEAVYGDSINIQGNSININQDLSQTALQIYQQVVDFQNQGDSSEEAQRKVADRLATQVKHPGFRHHLQKVTRYLGTEAANGLIGEAAVFAVKGVLGFLGIPLF